MRTFELDQAKYESDLQDMHMGQLTQYRDGRTENCCIVWSDPLLTWENLGFFCRTWWNTILAQHGFRLKGKEKRLEVFWNFDTGVGVIHINVLRANTQVSVQQILAALDQFTEFLGTHLSIQSIKADVYNPRIVRRIIQRCIRDKTAQTSFYGFEATPATDGKTARFKKSLPCKK